MLELVANMHDSAAFASHDAPVSRHLAPSARARDPRLILVARRALVRPTSPRAPTPRTASFTRALFHIRARARRFHLTAARKSKSIRTR